MQKEVFVCVEEAFHSIKKVLDKPVYNDLISLDDFILESKKRVRKVVISNSSDITDKPVYSFVPYSLILSFLLRLIHQVSIPIRLRLYAYVNSSLPRALQLYPTPGKPIEIRLTNEHSETSLFAMLGITPEEFEICQKDKYEHCYR